VQRAARFLGLGLGSLINVFGPQAVIIGGGVAIALGEPWIELVRSTARAQTLADPTGKIPILLAALGDDAGVLGAALLAREKFVDHGLASPADRADTNRPALDHVTAEAVVDQASQN
jgi:glucokinase